jgi:hypothetical protein
VADTIRETVEKLDKDLDSIEAMLKSQGVALAADLLLLTKMAGQLEAMATQLTNLTATVNSIAAELVAPVIQPGVPVTMKFTLGKVVPQ